MIFYWVCRCCCCCFRSLLVRLKISKIPSIPQPPPPPHPKLILINVKVRFFWLRFCVFRSFVELIFFPFRDALKHRVDDAAFVLLLVVSGDGDGGSVILLFFFLSLFNENARKPFSFYLYWAILARP